jgi:hypothetical protein
MSRNGKTKPPAPMMAIFVVEVMVAAYGAGTAEGIGPVAHLCPGYTALCWGPRSPPAAGHGDARQSSVGRPSRDGRGAEA